MSAKRLEQDSDYAEYDADGDGVVTDEELETSKELQELKISNERAQAQRSMSWFALWCFTGRAGNGPTRQVHRGQRPEKCFGA